MPQRDVVIVGGGQAGLAAAYHLKNSGVDYVVLDAGAEVGASWRNRWRSLRLFTPAKYDGLPGLPFPAAPDAFPTREDMADYLRRYAIEHALRVELGKPVRRLRKAAEGYTLELDGGPLTTRAVVIATGSNPVPRRPPFARELDPAIVQLHSSDYQGPSDVPDGDVLVVGAGSSGVDLALELAATHRVFLAGHLNIQVPKPLLQLAGGAVWWWIISHVLTTRTPMGRKARRSILAGSGAPLIRSGAAELEMAGVLGVPRVTGTQAGQPRLADGRSLDVRSVVWATGFRPDFSWIDFDATDEWGWIANRRGVSTKSPGLYCVGMPFQSGLTSALVGGIGADAAYVAGCITAAHEPQVQHRPRLAARLTLR